MLASVQSIPEEGIALKIVSELPGGYYRLQEYGTRCSLPEDDQLVFDLSMTEIGEDLRRWSALLSD